MKRSFIPYSTDILPDGFRYPGRYLEYSQGSNFPEKIVWDFESAETDGGQLSWSLRFHYKEWKNIGNKNLIPFAQLNDMAAYFDGDDTSGNPKVFILDLGNKEYTYERLNFDSWLRDALEDSGYSPQMVEKVMARKPFVPYADDLLPKGFKYPELYIQFSQGIDFPEGLAWKFQDAYTPDGELIWVIGSTHKEWHVISNRNLIPFAQLDNETAFFEGNDTSGNPVVVIIDLVNNEYMYELANFDEWLQYALE